MRSMRCQAFTLLEMSIVIGVITLILGFALSLGTNMTHSADRVATQERMKTIQMALESYAKANGYLPCPANRATTPASTTSFGLESRSGTGCSVSSPGIVSVTVSGNSAYIGGVPVRTLGLPDAYAGDAWSNKFTYAVSAPHVAGPTSYSGSNPTLSVYYGDRTVSGAHYALSDASVAGYGATYVLVSHGPDGRGSFPLNATAVAISCGTGDQNDVENCDDGNLIFYDTDYNDGNNAAQYFDDYVLWGSNTLSRTATTPVLGCPANVCEPWCAQCMPNAMVPNSNLPLDPANIVNPVLCEKIITSTSPCRATCTWSGTVPSESNHYARCP